MSLSPNQLAQRRVAAQVQRKDLVDHIEPRKFPTVRLCCCKTTKFHLRIERVGEQDWAYLQGGCGKRHTSGTPATLFHKIAVAEILALRFVLKMEEK